ncbi:MAG: hypothetical protein A2Y92_04705 [Chloroflexi bacterium RBG_13_57_8]|nr:MAG: hypothetical protein A2Y92_04705 [Chloroflexi bacterium RBG_13_57_8]
MDKTKYGKYFISSFTETKEKGAWNRNLKIKDETPLLRIDGDIIKGITCFAQCNWFWPSLMKIKVEDRSTRPHSHTYDEVIGFIGTNFDDPADLGGEIEINMGGEKHILTKSSLVFIPAGLEHGPFRELRMDRPIFLCEFGLSGTHD